jgi:hypothetical protein
MREINGHSIVMRLYIFVEGFLRSTHVSYSNHRFSWTETLSSALRDSRDVKKRFSRLLLQVSQSLLVKTAERGAAIKVSHCFALLLLDDSHKAAEASGLSILQLLEGHRCGGHYVPVPILISAARA